TRSEVALYVLNHKRAHLRELEARFRLALTVNADPTIAGQQPFVIEKGEQVHTLEQAKAFVVQPMSVSPEAEDDVEDAIEEVDEDESFADMDAPPPEPGESTDRAFGDRGDGQRGEGGRRRRRRRRRGRRGEGHEPGDFAHDNTAEHTGARDGEFSGNGDAEPMAAFGVPHEHEGVENGDAPEGGGDRRRRRRGRRGGRRNRRGREGEGPYPAHEAGGGIEPEVGRAVADFDATPPAFEQPAA